MSASVWARLQIFTLVCNICLETSFNPNWTPENVWQIKDMKMWRHKNSKDCEMCIRRFQLTLFLLCWCIFIPFAKFTINTIFQFLFGQNFRKFERDWERKSTIKVSCLFNKFWSVYHKKFGELPNFPKPARICVILQWPSEFICKY